MSGAWLQGLETCKAQAAGTLLATLLQGDGGPPAQRACERWKLPCRAEVLGPERAGRTQREVRHAAVRGVQAALVQHVARPRVRMHVPRQHQVHLTPLLTTSASCLDIGRHPPVNSQSGAAV